MTRIRPLVYVAVVIVLAAVVVILARGRLPWSDARPAGCDIPDRVSGQSGPAKGIRVAEQGFTQDPATGVVQLGAVLENTDDRVAYRTTVTFRLFDATHKELPESGAPLVTTVPILLPGQRIGAGTGTYRGDVRVTSVEITPGTTTWLARSAVGSFRPVLATYERTARFNPRIPTSVDIHYREKSSNCRDLTSLTTAALFRDPTGKLVGGGQGSPDTPIIFRDEQGNDLGGEPHRPPTPSCSPGERETWIVPPTGAPTTATDTRTELYPYCDLG
jgi:hypothetical protein